MTYLFTSEPKKIGKREWRVVVCHFTKNDGGPFVEYEWRWPAYKDLDPAGPWEPMSKYPSYDSNDGAWAGCPKRLRTLYEVNKAKLQEAMKREEG
jgi:hypothetical protein